MADVRTNIFGIGEVYELQREGQWVERNRESYREYGYFGTASTVLSSTRPQIPAGNATSIFRIDYSNDTTSPNARASVTVSRGETNVLGNSNFGYFAGGWSRVISGVAPPYTSASTYYSTVDRINYANDTAALNINPSPHFSINYRACSFGNSNFGYFGGGYISGTPSRTSSIERINYANDNFSYVGSFVNSFGVSNGVSNADYGYSLGGYPSIHYTKIDRIDFSNDLATPLSRGNLVNVSRIGSATGNSNFGYLAQGVFPTKSNIHRISYANDLANSSIRTFQSSPRWFGYAMGNSNFGYFIGGGAIVDRIDYANDTSSVAVRGALSISASSGTDSATSSSSFGGSPVSYLGAPWVATAPFGYFAGGAGSPDYSSVQRLNYSNDTKALSFRGPLSFHRRDIRGVGNSNFGYFCGGRTPTPTTTRLTTVDRIDYSNDSASASVRGPLSSTGYNGGATGNSNFGYIGGGNNNARVDRIQYSNDSINVSVRGSLNRERSSATGNSNFGYFGGGSTPTSVSTIDRVDYSNDSVTASLRGLLSSNKFTSIGLGNFNFGYFGGNTVTSVIDRVDFSNDTVTASIRGKLSLLRYGMSSTGNSNFGYWGGGYNPSPVTSILERIDYSNDTQTASVRGSLLFDVVFQGASSSQAFGGAPNTSTDPLPAYIRDATTFDDRNTLDLPFKRVLGSYGYWSFFGGAYSAPFISTTERIDYANDTTSALTRGGMNTPRGSGSMFGNSNFGYTAGGRIPSNTSIIERIDYSNDSTIQNRRANLVSNQYRNTATNSESYGYNFRATNDSRYERLDFSNDLVNASYGGRKTTTLWHGATTFNKNYAYYAAGIFASASETNSIIDRIDFSNDNVTASVRGRLTGGGAWHMGGVGNNDFGYYICGYARTNIDRLDYSNDLTNTSLRGNNSPGRMSGNSNLNYGYFSGGGASHRRIDFANDTDAPIIRGALSASSGYLKSTTNARNS